MREPFVDYVRRAIPRDAVLIACGLPATNKTETTEVVARELGFAILRTDLIRRDLLKGEDIFDEKVAADMSKRHAVYDEMFRRAGEIAARGEPVILDATFVTQSLRRRAAEVAARHDRTFVIQQTQAPRAYSIDKIGKRSRENYESNALTEAAYDNNLNKFEPVDLADLRAHFPALRVVHLLVDTGSDLETEWAVIGRNESSGTE